MVNSKKSCTFAAVLRVIRAHNTENIFINRLCWAVDEPLIGYTHIYPMANRKGCLSARPKTNKTNGIQQLQDSVC